MVLAQGVNSAAQITNRHGKQACQALLQILSPAPYRHLVTRRIPGSRYEASQCRDPLRFCIGRRALAQGRGGGIRAVAGQRKQGLPSTAARSSALRKISASGRCNDAATEADDQGSAHLQCYCLHPLCLPLPNKDTVIGTNGPSRWRRIAMGNRVFDNFRAAAAQQVYAPHNKFPATPRQGHRESYQRLLLSG